MGVGGGRDLLKNRKRDKKKLNMYVLSTIPCMFCVGLRLLLK